jgi:macrolide-specific efflux system membrane fusion protein
MRRFYQIGIVVLAIAVVASALWYWGNRGAQAQDQYPTATVTRGDIEDDVTALGTLQPLEYVDVGTQVSGQLQKLHVNIGDTVKAQDLLAEIDPTVYASKVDADQAQLLNLKAQLQDKQSQRALAEQQLNRQSGLIKARATSEDALQTSQAAFKSATAQVASLQAQIQQTESALKGDQANLGYTKIYAPMAGTVVSLTAKQGQTLNANQQAPIVMRIADLSTMTVWTQVSEADVSKLRIGMDAYFATLGQPSRRWSGKLRQILPTPEVINNVILYDVLFDVPNPDGQLMTQMSAQVFFVRASAKDALVLPLAALQGGGQKAKRDAAGNATSSYTVQVLKEGKTEDRQVTVGTKTRVLAEVLSGLAEGEVVVLHPGPAKTSAAQASPVNPAMAGARVPR